MPKGYKIFTVTHRDVQLEQISDFALRYSEEKELQNRLAKLKAKFDLKELLYITTCNRVLYLFYKEAEIDADFTNTFLQDINANLSPDFIQQVLSVYEGKEAILHFFEVAASIDSLVVGEREIMRQIRAAYAQSNDWGQTGDNIRLLMKYLVIAAKEVYAKTRIGEKQVSVVSLAMHQLKQKQLSKDARILLVGAGQTNTLVSKFLIKQGFQDITVFNRSLKNAQILATAVNGPAYKLGDLQIYDKGFDCLIVCTGATSAIIDAPLYRQLLHGEADEKVVMDLGIPNDVDKTILTQFPIAYIDIEDLKELAELNLAQRRQEIGLAKILLKEQASAFERAFKVRQIEVAMRDLPLQIKAIKQRALNEVFKKDLENMDEETRALFEKMLNYMEKKCIGIPMKVAKELAG